MIDSSDVARAAWLTCDDVVEHLRRNRGFVEQALAMDVEDVVDLLAALAERDLHWLPGDPDDRPARGVLVEGQPEPPDLHVVFDSSRQAWQRDDQRASETHLIAARWYGPHGVARSWAGLRRDLGPLTPPGGIAPTTPTQGEL